MLPGFIVLFAVVLVLGFDLIIVLIDGNYTRSISRWVYRTSKDFLILPFLAGVAAGHFFWPLH